LTMDSIIQSIIDEALAGHEISHENALQLLRIDSKSPEAYAVFSAANQMTREQFHGFGEVHAQIGVNYAPCPKRCKFCVFGTIAEKNIELDVEEVVARAGAFESSGANAVYLMTTGGYDFDKFIDIGEQVKKHLSPRMPLIANIGDFGPSEAQALAEAGFTAIYHAIRLREGQDTAIDPNERKRTIKSAQDAGLSALFCLEPIGPEHSDKELVDLMFLGKELGVTLHGAMRRVSMEGMPLHHHGETNAFDLAKAVAVCRLVVGDSVLAHCTHEPNLPSLLTGANLLWAETGPNPRDAEIDTSATHGRGLNVEECRRMLWEAGFEPLRGPSRCAQRQQ
jgi:biotin synthase